MKELGFYKASGSGDITFGKGFIKDGRERRAGLLAYRRECNGEKSSGVSGWSGSGVPVVAAMNKGFGDAARRRLDWLGWGKGRCESCLRVVKGGIGFLQLKLWECKR